MSVSKKTLKRRIKCIRLGWFMSLTFKALSSCYSGSFPFPTSTFSQHVLAGAIMALQFTPLCNWLLGLHTDTLVHQRSLRVVVLQERVVSYLNINFRRKQRGCYACALNKSRQRAAVFTSMRAEPSPERSGAVHPSYSDHQRLQIKWKSTFTGGKYESHERQNSYGTYQVVLKVWHCVLTTQIDVIDLKSASASPGYALP